MNWIFWKKRRCPICDERFEGKDIIWLKTADGMQKLNICHDCSSILQAERDGLLRNTTDVKVHEPSGDI